MDYDRLRELQEKFEENPRRYFAPLANEYRKGGQPKRAIEICRSQLSQMPGHMSGQIVYGQALYETGEFDEARQVFERALTLDPENLIALRSLGDMSLQSGNTAEARRWYTRLLDADPKDMAVIALVTEIDASAEAAPVPTPQEIPGVDEDAGDQAIPFIADHEGAPIDPENASSAVMESTSSPAVESVPPAAAESAPPAPPPTFEATAPSRPVEPEVPAEPTSAPEPIAASAPASPSSTVSDAAPPAGLERHYPVEPFDPSIPDVGIGAQGLQGHRQDEEMGAEGLRGTEPESPEPIGAEGLSGKPPVLPLAGAKGSRSDDEDALDTWTVPPDVAAPERVEPRVPGRVESRAPERAESRPPERAEPRAPERVEPRKEERAFNGPGPEPFVNETMAQLYLQQGYRQLALRVYYQLAASRPNDQALKDRIAEIEAADQAAHPEIQETPPVDRSPAEAPPPLSRRRESVEAPARAAPHAEPESVGARQPSIREFFATLGRRRPPRSAGNSGGVARPSNKAPSDSAPSISNAAPSASLDAVFAGATVSPADSRAASRLAGAFSGASGSSRTNPPTPPMPTPRMNPRVPQVQESEEDVAKFRAWLDGLTGE
jgi:tetratricopeptide (TPR) repeat protein